jgi:hypothetical protein
MKEIEQYKISADHLLENLFTGNMNLDQTVSPSLAANPDEAYCNE